MVGAALVGHALSKFSAALRLRCSQAFAAQWIAPGFFKNSAFQQKIIKKVI
jgi:hypothetical protein